MTREELIQRARHDATEEILLWLMRESTGVNTATNLEKIQAIIGKRLADFADSLIAEERERCAKVAERTPFRAHGVDDVDYHSGCEQTRSRIAAAIRSGHTEGQKC